MINDMTLTPSPFVPSFLSVSLFPSPCSHEPHPVPHSLTSSVKNCCGITMMLLIVAYHFLEVNEREMVTPN
jgi:hypothetical protein